MYIDSSIDSSYKYIAELTNNYVILTKNRVLESNDSYDAVLQFFNPSTDFEYISNYKPKLENAASLEYTYLTNNFDELGYYYTQNCIEIETDSDFFSRPDYANIIIGVTSICVFASVIINCVTSLVVKGGLFRND